MSPRDIVRTFQDLHDALHDMNWPLVRKLRPRALKLLTAGNHPTATLVAWLFDRPYLQQLAVSSQRPITPALTAPATRISEPGRPLQVGYLSNDFCNHATAYLVVETLEQHDPGAVKVHLYDYSRDDGSELRARIVRSAAVHRDIGGLSDAAAAQLIARDRIDILVDLKGQIANGRPGILRYRPAPVIINYLGYPGTNGPSCDYIITDRMTFPGPAHFHEKPLFLPTFYLPYGNQLPAPGADECSTFRRSLGLADDAVLIGCLNATYKVSQEICEIWRAALERHSHVHLAVLATGDAAAGRYREFFGNFGARLHVLPKGSSGEHLLRIASLDLFVDTFHVGAHTVALDAAMVGTPLLTIAGQSYISRVAASVNSWMGQEEFNAGSPGDYAVRLDELLTDRARLAEAATLVRTNAHRVINRSLACQLEALYQTLLE